MNEVAQQAGQFLTFGLGSELFAIDVQRVREVLDLSPITRVPQAAEFMLGVVNVRGNAVPVINLRSRFGLPPAATTVNTRIIVLDLTFEGEVTPLGALADSVNEVLDIDENQITPPPRIGSRWRTDFIRGLSKREEDFLIILDIDRIFTTNDAMLAAEAANVPLDPAGE